MATIYGYLYLIFTAMPALFEGDYGFSTGSVGLSYLGIGVGSIIGLLTTGLTSDRLVVSLTAKNGGEAKPEYRLPPIMLSSILVPIGLFWYGWTAETTQHWIMPIIGTGIFGCGMVVSFVSTMLTETLHVCL